MKKKGLSPVFELKPIDLYLFTIPNINPLKIPIRPDDEKRRHQKLQQEVLASSKLNRLLLVPQF